MFRSLSLGACSLFLFITLPIQAQESVVGQLYGRGTHAYFSGDLVQAHQLLTAAIEGDAKDPRAHYYRGLVYLKLNRAEEAQADFKKGAELEAADSNVFYDVSHALQRVQGQPRLAIERYRSEARVAAMSRAKAVQHARYEAIRSEESRVVQRDAVITPEPIEQEKTMVAEAKPSGNEPPVEDPFAEAPSDTPEKESNLFSAFGKAIGQTVSKKIQDGTKMVGENMPGGNMGMGGLPIGGMNPGSGAMPPAGAGNGFGGDSPFGSGDPFGGIPVPPKAAATPKKAVPETEPQGGALGGDDPFGSGDPFGATPKASPAPSREKQAGRPPVTKPKTKPGALPSGMQSKSSGLRGGLQSSSSGQGASTGIGVGSSSSGVGVGSSFGPAQEPGKGDPFVDEPPPSKKQPPSEKQQEPKDDPFAPE